MPDFTDDIAAWQRLGISFEDFIAIVQKVRRNRSIQSYDEFVEEVYRRLVQVAVKHLVATGRMRASDALWQLEPESLEHLVQLLSSYEKNSDYARNKRTKNERRSSSPQ